MWWPRRLAYVTLILPPLRQPWPSAGHPRARVTEGPGHVAATAHTAACAPCTPAQGREEPAPCSAALPRRRRGPASLQQDSRARHARNSAPPTALTRCNTAVAACGPSDGRCACCRARQHIATSPGLERAPWRSSAQPGWRRLGVRRTLDPAQSRRRRPRRRGRRRQLQRREAGAFMRPARGCSGRACRRWSETGSASGPPAWSRRPPAAASAARPRPRMHQRGGSPQASRKRRPHSWQGMAGPADGNKCKTAKTGNRRRACEYHTMPIMAVAMPRNFLSGISSPKNRHPPVRIMTVLMWPTTLYVRLDVAPMTCARVRRAAVVAGRCGRLIQHAV